MLSNLHIFSLVNPQNSSVVDIIIPTLQTRKASFGGVNDSLQKFKIREY